MSMRPSPAVTTTPGGPGAPPPLRRAGRPPPPHAAGLAKPRLKRLPSRPGCPLPPGHPPGTRAACLHHWAATSATARAVYDLHAWWSPLPVCAGLLPVYVGGVPDVGPSLVFQCRCCFCFEVFALVFALFGWSAFSFLQSMSSSVWPPLGFLTSVLLLLLEFPALVVPLEFSLTSRLRCWPALWVWNCGVLLAGCDPPGSLWHVM